MHPPASCSPPSPPGGAVGFQSLWEVSLLRSHVHPSVSKFAEGLLSPSQQGVNYSGDPLADFALMPFLNRMAYKNPKAKKDHARVPGTVSLIYCSFCAAKSGTVTCIGRSPTEVGIMLSLYAFQQSVYAERVAGGCCTRLQRLKSVLER